MQYILSAPIFFLEMYVLFIVMLEQFTALIYYINRWLLNDLYKYFTNYMLVISAQKMWQTNITTPVNYPVANSFPIPGDIGP